MKQRDHYHLTLRPEPDCHDPMMALRKSLKVLLRSFRLRCTSVSQVEAGATEPAIKPPQTADAQKGQN